MKKNNFYRRQLSANISYFIWMCFLWIFAVPPFVLTVIFILEAYFHFDILFSGDPLFRGDLSEIILVNLVMLGLFGFFAGAIVISWVRISKRRRKLYQKLRLLSDEEQMDVNAEIVLKSESIRPSRYQIILLGSTRMYFRAHLFLHFVNYRDIVWVYPYIITIPIIGAIGDDIVMTDTGMNVTALMIWERDGTKYKINMGADAFLAQETIERIKENAPNVIVGFNKQRHRLAKKDFERFIREGATLSI